MELEIAVQDSAGAQIALEGGADRVELCAALCAGGVTPSGGEIVQTVAVGLPVHVLIRPRPGGFVYSPAEVAVMRRDIATAVSAGAAGVVIGALRDNNELDMSVLTQLVTVAREQSERVDITLHRCVDVCLAAAGELAKLAAQASELGCARILSSGGAARVGEGIGMLAALQEAWSAGTVQAGGGVQLADFPALRAAGIRAAHLSARGVSTAAGAAGPGGGPAEYEVTDPGLVAGAVAAAHTAY